jgi:hypothetical protein
LKRLDVKAELPDGRVVTAKTTVADTMLYEKTARKHKWSLNIQENPSTWETFIGWAAIKRTGQTDLGYEAFCDEALEISVSVPDEDEGREDLPGVMGAPV